MDYNLFTTLLYIKALLNKDTAFLLKKVDYVQQQGFSKRYAKDIKQSETYMAKAYDHLKILKTTKTFR